MSMKHLNGWQRLWVVACVLLGTFCALVVYQNLSLGLMELFMLVVQYWLVPCAALYALGWSVGWIMRGFRNGSR
ncbi:hypothetical protein D3C81_1166710 [compost metagenome]